MKKYYKHSIKNIIQLRSIVTIEYLELPVNYLYPSETHNFWELVYIDKGSIVYYINDRQTPMTEGDLFFLSPGQNHAIRGADNLCSNIFVLCFDCPSPLLNILKDYKTCLKKEANGILMNLLAEANNTFQMPVRGKTVYLKNGQPGGEQMIRLYLELFLITMLRNQYSNKTDNCFFLVDNVTREICNTVIKTLESSIYKRISIGEICESIHYSKSYVCRLFKAQTGKTIITYFNELKIAEAKKLMRETSFTMEKISDLLNFSDPRYFNFLFKKIVHRPPLQYKNSIQNSQIIPRDSKCKK